jgi:transposase
MKQIREILRLFEKDLSRRMIAKALNISRPVVSEYIKQFQDKGIKYCQIVEISDTELSDKLGFSATAKSDKFKLLESNFPAYIKELSRTGVTLQLLWQEYRENQPDGYSRSQFSHYFRKWKKENKLSMQMEHKAGDKMFVDFTGQHMQITDRQTGEIQDVEVFVSILGASQKTFACATVSQKKTDWIWANVKSLEYFGGVPAGIVPDCLKSAVTKGCKYEPVINQDYDDFAEHYNLAILPARPYHPKDKSLAENAVRLIYQRIFAPLRNEVFHSLAELNQAILVLLEKHNDSIMKSYNASRNQMFEDIEASELKPLPLTAFEIKESKVAKVAFNYHVYLGVDKHHYSVPHRYVGQMAKLRYNHSIVEVFVDHMRVATHQPGCMASSKRSLRPALSP